MCLQTEHGTTRHKLLLIEVIALGFGSAVKAFLESIASIDEFASLTDLSELSGSFSKIAQTIGDGSGGSIKEVE